MPSCKTSCFRSELGGPDIVQEQAAEIERLRARNAEHEERYSALEALDSHRKEETERLRAARTWQSISTAPKDGSEVDLLCRNWEGAQERWCGARWEPEYDGSETELWRGPWSDGFESGLPDHRLVPTHWMRPPEMPDIDEQYVKPER